MTRGGLVYAAYYLYDRQWHIEHDYEQSQSLETGLRQSQCGLGFPTTNISDF